MPDAAPSQPPTLPPPFDAVGERRFSFYPPILNIDHNEWNAKEATWSEVLVVNAKTADPVWIPRQYVGELSRVDEPVMIVGLKRELEFKAGGVWPHVKRVLEMPRGLSAPPRSAAAAEPLPKGMSAIHGAGSPSESRIGRLILISLVAAIALVAVVVGFYRGQNSVDSATFKGVMQANLGFSAQDNYHAVVRKLGPPAGDRWKNSDGELRFRILDYPARALRVVLMGHEQEDGLYVGAVDTQGRLIDSVSMPGGASTAALVRQATQK